MDTMDDRLKAYSSLFSSMVELIPAKFYLTKDPEMSDDSVQSNKYWVNKKSKAPKQFVKEATKRARRVKLDPDSHKTIQERQREAHSETKNSSSQEGKFEGLMNAGVDTHGRNGFSVETVKSTELGDLRERLQTKIEGLRGKRKTQEDDPEQIVQKKRKVMEKRKRRKEARQRKKQQQKTADKVKVEKDRLSIKDERGKIVFSKFDFSHPSKPGEGSHRKKDYQRLLAKAEATEKRLEELKKNDEKRGEELQERLQWKKAMDLAKGSKVKDDPKLIKKSLKRLDKKKSKSRKQWLERASQEQAQKEKRQEVRKKHIQERIEKIKAKKGKKKFKKTKRTPGF